LDTETKFIVVRDSKIRVRELVPKAEAPARPVVIFLHGYSFSIDDWERVGTLQKVADQGYRVVAIDLPRGRATKSDRIELNEPSDYNPVLEQLLSQLRIPKTKSMILVGPSMGGGFALAYALEHSERVAGVVLIAPALEKVLEFGSNSNADTQARKLGENVPILLVWGESDEVFPLKEYAQPLQESLPNSRLQILKGARHAAYLDNPEEFHKVLLSFLEEVDAARQ